MTETFSRDNMQNSNSFGKSRQNDATFIDFFWPYYPQKPGRICDFHRV